MFQKSSQNSFPAVGYDCHVSGFADAEVEVEVEVELVEWGGKDGRWNLEKVDRLISVLDWL